jgi:hypothetical protein
VNGGVPLDIRAVIEPLFPDIQGILYNSKFTGCEFNTKVVPCCVQPSMSVI